MNFEIIKTWDGVELSEGQYKMMLTPSENGNDLVISVRGPLFNVPPAPEGDPGKPFHQLWDYEGTISKEYRTML